MKRSTLKFTILLALLLAVLALLMGGCAVLPEEVEPEEGQLPLPKALTNSTEIELSNQIQAEAAAREDVLAFIMYRVVIDSVDFSQDGDLALAWLALVDKDTGYVQPGEPGLVIAHRTDDPEKPWRLVFQADSNFTDEIIALPEEMLSAENKERYLPGVQKVEKAGKVYTGYRLPWPKGQTVRVSGSIGHVYTYKSCPSSCLYAFDFANGTMFDVVAARQGTVKYAVWKYENGNTKNANYIVLEDTSTNPTTYQVYLHLAQNSIPAELRKVGAKVVQGQFLGKADDTGFSTGHHLHFHVHTNAEDYWGKSVDIVFEDVSINGGRPRTCSESGAFPQLGDECMPGNRLVSDNGDREKPTGGITSPKPDSTIKAPTLNVSGWMKDDIGVQSAQLMYKTVGDWKFIGEQITKEKFSTTIDLCEARIPDGKFKLTLVVTDRAGNVATAVGRMDLVKRYDCPPLPPVCTPADDEIALHNDTEFQGSCQLLKIGEYADLSALELVRSDQALSLQVGAGVTAMVYSEPNFAGTMELFQDGDDNLANNLVGAGTISSVKVVNRLVLPTPPAITFPESITVDTDLAVVWTVEEGNETRAALSGKGKFLRTIDWQTSGNWQIGYLPMGDYKLTVESRNLLGTASTTQEFSVKSAVPPPSTRLNGLPQTSGSNAIPLSWVVEDGAEDIERFELQYRPGNEEWKNYPEEISGTARSLLLWGRQDVVYEFRLRAVNNAGVAEDYSDKAETFTYILATCIGDDADGGRGIDNKQAGASRATAGVTVKHNWCPAEDVDWVRFDAKAGDSFILRAVPHGTASAAVIQLYAAGSEVLLGEARPVNADSNAVLNWTAPRNGAYAVKLTPADARIVGVEAVYDFTVEKKSSVKPLWFIIFSAMVSGLLGGGYVTAKKVQKSRKQMKSRHVGW